MFCSSVSRISHMLCSWKMRTWKSRIQMYDFKHSFRTLSQKVTISRAVLQRRWPAVCQLLSGRAASSFFYERPQGLRSRFIVRKFRLSLGKQPKTNHLLITLPCPFNRLPFFTSMVLQYASESKPYCYPCIHVNEWLRPTNLLEEEKKWKKGIC